MDIKSFFAKFTKNNEDSETDILTELPDIIILLNQDGDITWANEIADSFFTEFKEDFLQSNIDEFLESGLELIQKSANKEKPIVIRTKNDFGKDLFLEANAKILDEGLIVILRDHTQNYKNLTSILVEHECSKKVNRDKNTFLVKLSNDLKTPLKTICDFSDSMLGGLGEFNPKKQEKFVRAINNEAYELYYLIDKVLELSKTESSTLQSNFQLFDALNTLKQIIKFNEKNAQQKKLSLNLTFSDEIKQMVYSDESLLKTIFQNILETAIKYSKSGIINIEVTHPDLEFITKNGLIPFENATETSFLMFKITDTSEGIAEEDLENLFEPYLQIDKPDKKFLTRSIAFASVKNIAKILKGNVWIDSNSAEGSIYNIIIPTEKVTQNNNE